ncbi:hypothetical protein T4A_14110 [Trichinella pseudospiralis]|uniref:Uncharacterized protein n=1 Tax=Trichinella pseudospiralis TaxID=6337 RepID=A0A0V1EE25_TRIPS|nr:hypothetical protein T4A_14110 [Trichinella pseudospiralis]
MATDDVFICRLNNSLLCSCIPLFMFWWSVSAGFGLLNTIYVLADVSSLNTAGIGVSLLKLCFVKTPSFHFFKTSIYLHYNSFHDLSDASLPLSGRLSI